MTNHEWFMRHGHTSELTSTGYRVRVWARGARQAPADGEGRTWDDAVSAARSRVATSSSDPAPTSTEIPTNGGADAR